MLVGAAIGFVLGYIVRDLRTIKATVEEVDEIVKQDAKRYRDESGFMRHPVLADVAMIAVLVLVVWSAFASQKSSNEVQETQDKQITQQKTLERIVECNQQFLTKTIEALNARTTYTRGLGQSNVALQKAQAKFLESVMEGGDLQRGSLETYFESLTEFVNAQDNSEKVAESYPYPKATQFNICLEEKEGAR